LLDNIYALLLKKFQDKEIQVKSNLQDILLSYKIYNQTDGEKSIEVNVLGVLKVWKANITDQNADPEYIIPLLSPSFIIGKEKGENVIQLKDIRAFSRQHYKVQIGNEGKIQFTLTGNADNKKHNYYDNSPFSNNSINIGENKNISFGMEKEKPWLRMQVELNREIFPEIAENTGIEEEKQELSYPHVQKHDKVIEVEVEVEAEAEDDEEKTQALIDTSQPLPQKGYRTLKVKLFIEGNLKIEKKYELMKEVVLIGRKSKTDESANDNIQYISVDFANEYINELKLLSRKQLEIKYQAERDLLYGVNLSNINKMYIIDLDKKSELSDDEKFMDRLTAEKVVIEGKYDPSGENVTIEFTFEKPE